jgi:hypothetical protein
MTIKFPIKSLIFVLALIYLTIPIIIFVFGWCNYLVSLPISLFFFLVFRKLFKEIFEANISENFNIDINVIIKIIVIFLFNFIFFYFSGTGSVSYQNSDFYKHNGMLIDLINHSWPVSYKIDKISFEDFEKLHLTYYMAYYLPAALIGKVTSVGFAALVNWVWGYFGLLLASGLLLILFNKFKVGIVIFFFLFSGLDYVGKFILDGGVSNGVDHIEWWARYWQYSGNAQLLFWVPNQVIGGWIALLLIFIEIFNFQRFKNVFFLFSLTTLWSPFMMLGMMPIITFSIISKIKNGNIRNFFWTNIYSKRNLIVAPSIMLIFFFYYKSRLPEFDSFWFFSRHSFAFIWPKYLLFLFLEFGIYVFLFKDILKAIDPEFNNYVILSSICLILIPFYKYGMANDFCMRASIPLLFVIQIGFIKSIMSLDRKHFFEGTRKVLVLVFFIGSMSNINELMRSISHWGSLNLDYRSIVYSHPIIFSQYLSKDKSFFYEYLSKATNSYQVVPEETIKEESFKNKLINQKYQ